MLILYSTPCRHSKCISIHIHVVLYSTDIKPKICLPSGTGFGLAASSVPLGAFQTSQWRSMELLFFPWKLLPSGTMENCFKSPIYIFCSLIFLWEMVIVLWEMLIFSIFVYRMVVFSYFTIPFLDKHGIGPGDLSTWTSPVRRALLRASFAWGAARAELQMQFEGWEIKGVRHHCQCHPKCYPKWTWNKLSYCKSRSLRHCNQQELDARVGIAHQSVLMCDVVIFATWIMLRSIGCWMFLVYCIIPLLCPKWSFWLLVYVYMIPFSYIPFIWVCIYIYTHCSLP